MEFSNEPMNVRMTIPCRSDFVGIVRLAISGIATRMNFTIEEIEDIKIAVSEACTNSVQYAYDNDKGSIEIDCNLFNDKLEIVVSDKGKGFDIENAVKTAGRKNAERNENKLGLGLGLTFIKSLMDDAEFVSNQDQGTTIRMTKHIHARSMV